MIDVTPIIIKPKIKLKPDALSAITESIRDENKIVPLEIGPQGRLCLEIVPQYGYRDIDDKAGYLDCSLEASNTFVIHDSILGMICEADTIENARAVRTVLEESGLTRRQFIAIGEHD